MSCPPRARATLVAALFSLFSLPACAAPATWVVAPTSASARQAPSPAVPVTMAWTEPSEDGPSVTYSLDDQGHVLATRPGVHIAAGGTEWTWEEASETVATEPCEGEDGAPAGEGQGTRVRLRPADAAHDPLAIVVPPQGGEANEIDHSARLLASVGPYLFVEESTYEYSCGAHGGTSVEFAVWDIEEKGTVDLLAELPNRDRLLDTGRSTLDEEPDGVDFSSDDDPPALTELLPHVGPHGRLEANALVSIPSCYACTSGGWSSYTSSTPVPTELPPRLSKLGPVPVAVQRFLEAHPAVLLGGYSVESPR